MATSFEIPRQTDRELILALSRIRENGDWNPVLKIHVNLLHRDGDIKLPDAQPEQFEDIQFALKLSSNVFHQFTLKTPSGTAALTIKRNLPQLRDTVDISDWVNQIPDSLQRAKSYALMVASARMELKAHDVDASLNGAHDNAWNSYRDAQMSVINSLQQASETLLIKTADRNAELDRARSARFEQLEKELRDEISNERKRLQSEAAAKEQALSEGRKQLSDREASFNTKEARYVARKKQEEQIEQVKNWLNDWKLTPGTTQKRRGVLYAYIAALVVTGFLTAYATYHNYQLLRTADDLVKLQWWHWLLIISKSLFPLATFTTFMVYFIRWSSTWARQHADEEFINRTRLIDIGRAAWLLEAVRDAQERDKEIPAELLKELSRNLFSQMAINDADPHPQAAADILLQGLSSLRVKSADGTEMEARRGK
jgi:hypothetical protein